MVSIFSSSWAIATQVLTRPSYKIDIEIFGSSETRRNSVSLIFLWNLKISNNRFYHFLIISKNQLKLFVALMFDRKQKQPNSQPFFVICRTFHEELTFCSLPSKIMNEFPFGSLTKNIHGPYFSERNYFSNDSFIFAWI